MDCHSSMLKLVQFDRVVWLDRVSMTGCVQIQGSAKRSLDIVDSFSRAIMPIAMCAVLHAGNIQQCVTAASEGSTCPEIPCSWDAADQDRQSHSTKGMEVNVEACYRISY